MTTIFIPCKPLCGGKSRLTGILGDGERHALCRTLLIHTLDMARALVAAAQIKVLTGDAEARDLAASRGIAALDDHGCGLNAALTHGRAHCEATSFVVLPIDLPLASIGDLKAVLETNADVAIAPDGASCGTNLLCLRRRAMRALPFSFGRDSLRVHLQSAERLKLSVEIVRRPGLAADIDTPQDYARWRDAHGLKFAVPLAAA
jgi:2-phospho-L-lactate guanylyltransferase